MFTYAKLSGYDCGVFRILGDGLGNLLLPWARAIVGARKYGLIPIWPTWTQFKVGPVLRNEMDKRTYHKLFIPSANYISGFKKLYLLATCNHMSEMELLKNPDDKSERSIVFFSGMDDYFNPILKDHDLIKGELLNIIREEHKVGIKDYENSISVHVRLGDFSFPQEESDLDIAKCGNTNYRLPLTWYISMIKAVRRKMGEECKVYVFSDGRDEELSEILSLPRCERLGFGSSIADLLALSSSTVLIASGSIFSMWASFLGRMPVIWHTGQFRHKIMYERPQAEIELSQGQDIPDSFIETIAPDTL